MTRRVLFCGVLCCALLFAVAASAAAPANFAGTWVLDKSKSKDLPPQWTDNLEGYTLTVSQDDKQLTVEYKPEWKVGQSPMQGGGGGRGMGPGMGPGGRVSMSVTYGLDGKESTSESSGGRSFLSTFKADWKNDGKALELTNTRKFTTSDGEERTTKMTERWELSADGKALTVNRSIETPRGNTKSTMVFNKQ